MIKRKLLTVAVAGTMMMATGCDRSPGVSSSTDIGSQTKMAETITRDKTITSTQSARLTLTMPAQYLLVDAIAAWMRGHHATFGGGITAAEMISRVDKVTNPSSSINLVYSNYKSTYAMASIKDDSMTPVGLLADDVVKRYALVDFMLKAFEPYGRAYDCGLFGGYLIASEYANILLADMITQLQTHYDDLDKFRAAVWKMIDNYPIERMETAWHMAWDMVDTPWRCYLDKSDYKFWVGPTMYMSGPTGWTIKRYGSVVFGDGNVMGAKYQISMDRAITDDMIRRRSTTDETSATTGEQSRTDATTK